VALALGQGLAVIGRDIELSGQRRRVFLIDVVGRKEGVSSRIIPGGRVAATAKERHGGDDG
jgi:hypothetical protein